jgi:micrococcal nuclease
VDLKNFLFRCLVVAAFIFGHLSATHPAVGRNLEQSKEADEDHGEIRKVIRIVDGDTIVVSPNEKVRLIGVDTPETVHPKKIVECFGKDAKEFTRRAVEGKTIRLVLDDVNRARQHKDKYGRTLAYAYLEDGTMLNRELISQGYAHAYTRFRFRYRVEFRQLERTARDQAVGLWSSCRVQ